MEPRKAYKYKTPDELQYDLNERSEQRQSFENIGSPKNEEDAAL